MNYIHRGVFLIFLLILSACSFSPKTYKEAMIISSSQEKVLLDWVKKNKITIANVIPDVSKCLSPESLEKVKEIEQYDILLQLGISGDITQVFMKKGTSIERCFSMFMSKNKLPAPPIAPAYVPISINVKRPESKLTNEPMVLEILSPDN